MAAFICRFCGTPLELSGSTVCECPGCNRLQSVPLIDSAEKRGLLTRAEQLRKEQRYDKAIQLYEKMISLSPTDADLYWALALCRYGVLFFADGGLTLLRTQAHSFLSDSDYQQAVKFAGDKQRGFMESIAALIAEKQREISGLAVGIEYDVLLCCGSSPEAAKRSTELYNRLASEKFNVFCTDITLADRARSECEPYIYAAVNSARVLLIAVTGTDIFNDVTVMNICGRFLSEDLRGRAVIPILYGVLPGDLPPELSRFQAVNAANLGFEQDIIASIAALISGKSHDKTAQGASPLVRRAYIMLSDREFHEAEEICGRIEAQFPAEAALIRLLCEYRLTAEEELGKLPADITASENYRLAMQYGSEAIRLKLKKYALSAQEKLHAKELSEKDRTLESAIPDSSNAVYSAKVKPVKKRFPFRLLPAGIVAAGLIVGAVIVLLPDGQTDAPEPEISSVDTRYEQGKSLYENAEFREAEAVFISLGSYEDSADWVKKCRYMQAGQLLESGDPETAQSMYLRLGGYQDSAQKANECSYKLAEKIENAGDLKSAAEAFDALGSYYDSVSRKNICLYQYALELIDSGDLDSAEAVLKEIRSLSGSNDQLKRIQYVRAEEKYDLGAYQTAYEMFSKISGWSDSDDRAKDSLYNYAKVLYNSKQYYKAIDQLSKLGNYLDSHEMYCDCWLTIALEKLEEHDKRSAYSILSFKLRDYEPARPYLATLRNELLNGDNWESAVNFGEYYISDTEIKTSIDWKVLKTEGNRALLVTEEAVEYLPFDTNGNSAWADCSLRAWLNGEFYDSVFSDYEKTLISADGSDNVFLLNYAQASSMFTRALNPDRYASTICTMLKTPKNATLHSWGRDGVLDADSTVSTTTPELVFPAIWVRIE